MKPSDRNCVDVSAFICLAHTTSPTWYVDGLNCGTPSMHPWDRGGRPCNLGHLSDLEPT